MLEHEPDTSLVELAAAVRKLAESLLNTAVGDSELRSIRTAVDELTQRCESGQKNPGIDNHSDYRRIMLYNAVSGYANAGAPPLEITNQGPGAITAVVRLSGLHGGPIGRSHGGWVAAVLDEAMGRSVFSFGSTSLTIDIDVAYHKGTPLGVPLSVEAACERFDGKVVHAAARMSFEGQLCATATGRFLIPRDNRPLVHSSFRTGTGVHQRAHSPHTGHEFRSG